MMLKLLNKSATLLTSYDVAYGGTDTDTTADGVDRPFINNVFNKYNFVVATVDDAYVVETTNTTILLIM